jgi:excinuclease UvrABC ATPase subunit
VIVTSSGADGEWSDQVFSEKFACPEHPKVSLPELEPRLFSFNSPHGACPECHGLGTLNEFDPELIVADESLSLESTVHWAVPPQPRAQRASSTWCRQPLACLRGILTPVRLAKEIATANVSSRMVSRGLPSRRSSFVSTQSSNCQV